MRMIDRQTRQVSSGGSSAARIIRRSGDMPLTIADRWAMLNGQCSMANAQWPMLNGQCSIPFRFPASASLWCRCRFLLGPVFA